MTESARAENPMAAIDIDAAIAALKLAGADQIDPLRFCYIETLARRAAQQHGRVKVILDGKLEAALASFDERQISNANVIGEMENPLQLSPLGELVRDISQHSPVATDTMLDTQIGSRAELKSLRYFRNTWSKLSVDKQVAQALDQAPENAGPLNSHFLVLRSLTEMRDSAPDYLNRFMSYVDSLLCLDQADGKNKSKAKKSALAGRRTKKASPPDPA